MSYLHTVLLDPKKSVAGNLTTHVVACNWQALFKQFGHTMRASLVLDWSKSHMYRCCKTDSVISIQRSTSERHSTVLVVEPTTSEPPAAQDAVEGN